MLPPLRSNRRLVLSEQWAEAVSRHITIFLKACFYVMAQRTNAQFHLAEGPFSSNCWAGNLALGIRNKNI